MHAKSDSRDADKLKKVSAAGVIRISLWQSTGLIIGIHELTPLS